MKNGLGIEISLVGDGKARGEVEALAAQLELRDTVTFRGILPPGEPIRDYLDQIDLFVLPSRQEGLPRAMIEAMARGCPCIGSTIGGIPELLPAEEMVPPNDAEALARKIREVLSDPARMERMARRNWEVAKEYSPEILSERRREFYRAVRERFERDGNASRRSG